MNENDKSALYALGVVMTVALMLFYNNLRNQYYMEKGTKDTCATVYEWATSDAYGNRVLHFYWFADSVKYTGAYTSSFIEECPAKNDCVGYSFEITYATANPNIARIYLHRPCPQSAPSSPGP
jgi:hypothetical protein